MPKILFISSNSWRLLRIVTDMQLYCDLCARKFGTPNFYALPYNSKVSLGCTPKYSGRPTKPCTCVIGTCFCAVHRKTNDVVPCHCAHAFFNQFNHSIRIGFPFPIGFPCQQLGSTHHHLILSCGSTEFRHSSFKLNNLEMACVP